MKQALIHIGTGKTGSSSIQRELRNRQRHDRLGPLDYPLLESGSNHNALMAMFTPEGRLGRGIQAHLDRTGESREAFVARLAETFADACKRHDNIILSSEFLANARPDTISRLKDYLAQHGFTNVGIVLYVREPASYYLSMVQQMVRASSRISNPVRFRYNYLQVIENWATAFPDALTIRHFHREALTGGDVVADFLDQVNRHFGTALPLAAEAPQDPANASVSAESMYLLEQYRLLYHPQRDNVFMPDSDALFEALREAETTIGTGLTKPALREDVARTLIHNHRQIIENLHADYGIDLGHERLQAGPPPALETEVFSLRDILARIDDDMVTRLSLAMFARNAGVEPDGDKADGLDAVPKAG